MGAEPPAGLIAEAITRHGRVTIRARGRSMTPLIPDGSLLEIRGPIAALRSGQIVAALIDDELVVHRVHQTGPLIQLMGDNAHRPDPPLPAHAVIGAVHRVTTPRGWQLACTTVGALALGRLLVPAVRIVAALRRTLA